MNQEIFNSVQHAHTFLSLHFYFWRKSFNSREISNCLQHALEKPPIEMFKLLKQIVPSVESYDSSVD